MGVFAVAAVFLFILGLSNVPVGTALAITAASVVFVGLLTGITYRRDGAHAAGDVAMIAVYSTLLPTITTFQWGTEVLQLGIAGLAYICVILYAGVVSQKTEMAILALGGVLTWVLI